MHEEPGNLSPDPLASHVGSMPVNTVRARAFACTNVCAGQNRGTATDCFARNSRINAFKAFRGCVPGLLPISPISRLGSIRSAPRIYSIEISHARFSLRFESSRLVFNEG